MSFSLGEISALIFKAGRGAGLQWGEAEELASAVRWLSARGLPGPEAALTLLTTNHGASALSAGIMLSDVGLAGDVELSDVRSPLLVVPFVARVLTPEQGCDFDVNGFLSHVRSYGVECGNPMDSFGDLKVSMSAPRVVEAVRCARVAAISTTDFERLNALAARTYAPISDHSRLAGAGAGLADLD